LEALKRGHHVIATARDRAHFRDLEAAGAVTLALDVTAPLFRPKDIAKEAHSKYGLITHLVNAAGYVLDGFIEEIRWVLLMLVDWKFEADASNPQEDYDTFNSNVFGVLNVSRAVIPYFRATSGEKVIANFGSIGSWSGGPGYALYSATKWACSGISVSRRPEL
jgi:NAD(P)-dependent dehydrogenase (short-subunit alcohol dehydrogenase family)